jgi:hypothetical protein
VASKALLITRWDNPLLYAWTRCANSCFLRRHIEATAAVLERQRWADAPVNDGLFARRARVRQGLNRPWSHGPWAVLGPACGPKRTSESYSPTAA